MLNAVVVIFFGTRLLPICVLDLLFSRKRKDLGPAIDVMLSFSLVAAMIGFGHIGRLPPSSLRAWNVAVVCNVLGAGALRVVQVARSERTHESPDGDGDLLGQDDTISEQRS